MNTHTTADESNIRTPDAKEDNENPPRIQQVSDQISLQAIVENKQVMSLLAREKERFKKLIQHSSDIAVIIDKNGIEQYISDSVERITGYRPEECIGKSVYEFLHPDDEPMARKELSNLMQFPEIVRKGEYRHKKRNGGYVVLEAIGSNQLHDPAIAGFVLNVRDITERKNAEVALRQNEVLLRTAGRTARFGGWSVDLAINKVVWSEEVAHIHEMEPGYSPTVDEAIRFYAPEWRDRITSLFGACARQIGRAHV